MDEASIPLLRLEDQEDDSEDGSDSRLLPPNKDYHVFISYSSKDAEFVKILHRHLEDKMKFRCMVAERDFKAGASVMDNISSAIDRSHKTLFVVSANFLGSGYCDREVDFAYTYAMDTRQKDYVILLKIDDISLDRKLRICTYIDGADRDIKAIGYKIEMAYTGSNMPCTGNVDVTNGNNGKVVLRKYPVELCCRMFGGLEYVFPDLSEEDMKTLRDSHMEDSATHYQSFQTEINKTRLLRQYALFSEGPTRKRTYVMGGIYIGCLGFMLSMLFFINWGNGSFHCVESCTWFWILGTILSLIVSLGICLGLFYGWQRYFMTKIRSGLKSISLPKIKLKDSTVIVLPTLPLDSYNLHIVFIYYDVNACWNYLKEHTDWSDQCGEIVDEMRVRLFKDIIIQRYLENRSFPITNMPRHGTVTSDLCFCQMLLYLYVNTNGKQDNQTEPNEGEETCLMEFAGSEETCLMEVAGSEETCLKEFAGIEETCLMEVAGNEQSD